MAVSKAQQIIALVISALLASIFLVCLPVSASNFTIWNSINSGTVKELNSIWGTSSNDVFVVGSTGTIIHYDGSAWTSMNSGNTTDLLGVWGASSNNVFALGSSGTIIHYSGSTWSPMYSNNATDLHGVWGSSGTDVFAVGNSGTIIHYDGSAWTSLNSDNTTDLHGVWGASSNNVFAVGSSGTIMHYNGSAWSLMNSGSTIDLNSVWGANGTDVFVVGSSGTIMHYDGSAWSLMNSGGTIDLNGVWGTNGTDVFAVGSSGTIVHYDGSAWSPMNRNTINKLCAVWGFSSYDVFATGWSGTIARYLPPIITSISNNYGDQGVTLNVNISGRNLTGASEVRFGTGIAVNSFTVLNSNQLTANITIVTGADLGARDVSVTTPGGNFTLPDSFTVNQALPIITSISPDQDIQGATLNVTITGTNLAGASEVRFGTGIVVNSFTVLSSNQMTVSIIIVADTATGARDVSVTTTGGSFTLLNGFTVNQALPTVTSISPDQGNQETMLNVIIDGTNFTGATEVRLGSGIVVNSFTVLSSNQITASISIALDCETGKRDVSVTTPGGNFTLPNSFTVKQVLPTIASVIPDNVSQGATLDVAIAGTNLTGASELRLGTGIAVNSFTVLNSNQIMANITIVAGTNTGVRDVSITTPGGSFTLQNGFTVIQAPPTITSISPSQGNQGTTFTVIVSGSNLYGATSVSLGHGVTVQSFSNLSPTQLSVSVKIDAKAVTGMRDVSVITPGGSSTLSNSFIIKQKSLGTLFIALVWVGIAIVLVLFLLILNMLRKKRAARF